MMIPDIYSAPEKDARPTHDYTDQLNELLKSVSHEFDMGQRESVEEALLALEKSARLVSSTIDQFLDVWQRNRVSHCAVADE